MAKDGTKDTHERERNRATDSGGVIKGQGALQTRDAEAFMMNRTLLCAHCGTTIVLETLTDPVGTRLLVHLLGLHGELVAFNGLPRWAEILDHYFVLPSVQVPMPTVVRASAPYMTTVRTTAWRQT